MKNYKIKVNDEAESKEAQELFEQLGFKNDCGDSFGLVYVIDNEIGTDLMQHWDYYSEKLCQELTLPQLRDLVVLNRNDVKDANYLYGQRLVLKLETQDYKIWDLNKLEWVDHVGSQTDLRNGITRIQLSHTKEQGLISGADALRALADGKEVEYSVNNSEWELFAESKVFCPSAILSGINQNSQALSFRLKPRSLNILGVELNKEEALKFVEEYFS